MRPERHPAYLKFIRSLPCAVCSKAWGIEAAHTGPHGIGQKSSDYSAIPLCALHHRDSEVGLDSIGRAAFEDMHGVSVAKLVRRFQVCANACGVEAAPAKRKPVERALTLSGLRGSRLAR